MDMAFTRTILYVYMEGAKEFQILWIVEMWLKMESTALSKTPNMNTLRKQLNGKSNLFCLNYFS